MAPPSGCARSIVIEAKYMTAIILVFVNLQDEVDIQFDFES